MNSTTGATPSDPLNKRRTWLQFSTRTLLTLILLAAAVAWFAEREMASEQRREELIENLQNGPNDVFLDMSTTTPWRRRLAAWLRRKPATPTVIRGEFQKVDAQSLEEMVELFPDAPLDVSIDVAELSHEMRDVLRRVKTLVALRLYRGSIDTTDETIAWLGKLRATEGIEFVVNEMDDALLRRLAEAQVDACWIWGSGNSENTADWHLVTDEGLKVAAKFRNLRGLSIGDKSSDEGLAAFRDHPELYFVALVGPRYTDASAETLATLAKLSTLVLTDTKLTDAGVAKAIEKSSLYSLRIKRGVLGEKSIAAVTGLNSLRSVELTNVSITPDLLAAIGKHPLEWLTLDGELSDDQLKLLAPIAPGVRQLAINSPDVTDRGLTWLATATKLRHLDLHDTQATAATLKLIPGPIVSIRLGGPNIDASVLAEANRARTLQTVELYGPSIDEEALAALEPGYESLTLAGTRITATDLRSLTTAGKKVRVTVLFADDAEPPLTQQEVDEIKSASAGLTEVTLYPRKSADFERLLPKYARKATAESDAP